MDDFLALDISAAGMRVQRQRVRVVAENLANQQTTGPNGPYQRKEVVVESIPMFDNELTQAVGRIDDSVRVSSAAVTEIRPDEAPPMRVYDPSHPHADQDGFVAYPNISIFREMTDMLEASRSYEANLAASRTTKEMLNSALDLIRR